MTNEEQQLVMNLVTESITKEEFSIRYPVDINKDSLHVLHLLEGAIEKKDTDSVEYALMLGFVFGFSSDYIPVLIELIVADWHVCHEDIARLLQGFKDPSSIEALFYTALQNHEYLNYDDSHALAVKCIWALGYINTDSAIEKLKLLSTSETLVIGDAAKHQLQRLKS